MMDVGMANCALLYDEAAAGTNPEPLLYYDVGFPLFFYMLLAPTLLHIAASLLVSGKKRGESDGDENGDGDSGFEQVRVPFMIVMAVFSILVMGDGWVLGVEPIWTPYRPLQLWSVALYVLGASIRDARAETFLAWLAIVTYVVAGFFYRFLPGAFGS